MWFKFKHHVFLLYNFTTYFLTVACSKRILGNVASEPIAHVPCFLMFFSPVNENISTKL